MKVEITRSDVFVSKLRVEQGFNVPRILEVEVDPKDLPEKAREHIIRMHAGAYPQVLRDCWTAGPGATASVRLEADVTEADAAFVGCLYLDTVQRLEKEVRERREKVEAEEEARLQAERLAVDMAIDLFLAEPAARPRVMGENFISLTNSQTKAMPVRATKTHPRWPELRAEVERREAADRQAREDIRVRKQEQVDAWVRDFGTENQRGRHALKLLPFEEVLAGVSAAAFAPLDEFAPYLPISSDDLPCTCEFETCDIDCEISEADSLTAEEYEVYTKLSAKLPESKILCRNHTCTREECEQTFTRRGAQVHLAVGEFTVKKEFAL